jgi:hypothetical protein
VKVGDRVEFLKPQYHVVGDSPHETQ